MEGCGRIAGVWVSGLKSWPALAVAYVRAASAGKNEKTELLYEYLSGTEFRQRVEAIFEAFEAMQT